MITPVPGGGGELRHNLLELTALGFVFDLARHTRGVNAGHQH
jgi:hypothetical protein